MSSTSVEGSNPTENPGHSSGIPLPSGLVYNIHIKIIQPASLSFHLNLKSFLNKKRHRGKYSAWKKF